MVSGRASPCRVSIGSSEWMIIYGRVDGINAVKNDETYFTPMRVPGLLLPSLSNRCMSSQDSEVETFCVWLTHTFRNVVNTYISVDFCLYCFFRAYKSVPFPDLSGRFFFIWAEYGRYFAESHPIKTDC